MTAIDYRSRLLSVLTRLEPILAEYGKSEASLSIMEGLQSASNEDELAVQKQRILALLNETLERIQLKFAQMEEPMSEDEELFKSYLQELRNYKQDLTTPYSPIRKKIASIIKESKTSLLSDIGNQAIIFPTEYLDVIVRDPKATKDDTGSWVQSQINDGLKAMADNIGVRIAACTDAINEVLDSQVKAFDAFFSSSISSDSYAKSAGDKLFSASRQALPAIGLGGITATVLTSIVCPAVGIVAGIATGGAFLLKSLKSTGRQQLQAEMKSNLAPKITLAINEMRMHVISQFDEIEEQVNDYVAEISSMLAAEMQDCIDALKSCENDQKEFSRQQELVNGQMNCIETYIKQVEVLMTNPFRINNQTQI